MENGHTLGSSRSGAGARGEPARPGKVPLPRLRPPCTTPTPWQPPTFYGPGWSAATPTRHSEKPPASARGESRVVPCRLSGRIKKTFGRKLARRFTGATKGFLSPYGSLQSQMKGFGA